MDATCNKVAAPSISLSFYVERKYATSATVEMLHFVANMFTTLYVLTNEYPRDC